jgi:hypothetical protein
MLTAIDIHVNEMETTFLAGPLVSKDTLDHRLNIGLDLQSLFELHVHSLVETPHYPQPPLSPRI